MTRPIFIVTAVACLAIVAGCLPARIGEDCFASNECGADDNECVDVGTTRPGVCVPKPTTKRAPQTCVDVESCSSGDTAWPKEAVCVDGLCRCPTSRQSCLGEGEVLEEETCTCVQRGRPGAGCETSFTCDEGLGCVDKSCQSASGSGSVCIGDNSCEGGTCTRRAGFVLGVCE